MTFVQKHNTIYCTLPLSTCVTTSGGSFGWMSGAINSELDWRWTFRLLGIAGIAMLPLAMLALWEPKKVREKRKQRIRGKSSYTVWVSLAVPVLYIL